MAWIGHLRRRNTVYVNGTTFILLGQHYSGPVESRFDDAYEGRARFSGRTRYRCWP